MGNEECMTKLSPDQLEKVSGGRGMSAEYTAEQLIEVKTEAETDPLWTKIDYECPRCHEKVYRKICPGTFSQLLCTGCGWNVFF